MNFGQPTANFGAVYGTPRSGGVAAAGPQAQVNPAAQSAAVTQMMRNTGSDIAGVTGMELPMLLALGALAWVMIRYY